MNNKSLTSISAASFLSDLAKDSLIYGGSDFTAKLVAFIAYPIIAAVLLPEEFGIVELITTSTVLIGLIMNCGLNNSVQRFYWDKDTSKSDQPVLASSGFFVMIFFGLLVVILGVLLMPMLIAYVDNEKLPITWVALISAIVLTASSQWLQYLLDLTRLHFSAWSFFSLSLLSRVLGLGLSVIAVIWFGWRIDGIMAMLAFSTLLILPLGVWLVRKDITKNFSLSWAKKLLKFGYPFIYAGIAFWIFGSMDRWMIASMINLEETGVYSISFRFVSIVLFVSIAFGNAWSPYAMKLRNDSPEIYREIYVHVLFILIFVMLIIGTIVALFSGELIGLILPKQYYGSAMPLTILCFGMILQSTTQVTAIGISIKKRTILFARIAWLSAIINLALNYILIPIYGIDGAAWATTLSY